MKTIDIVITSTSRPVLLARTIETMQEKLKFSGEFRWLLHEDVLNKQKSAIVQHNAKYSFLFNETIISDPHIGLGQSIAVMLPYVTSSIFFRTDDDWEYIRTINLDPLYDIFQEYSKINQIIFNKYAIIACKHGFERKDYLYNETWLTITRAWSWIPSLWRTSYAKEHYKTIDNVSGINLLSEIRLKPSNEVKISFLENNIGAYFLGKIGDRATYIKHLGGGSRAIEQGGHFGIY